MAYSFSYLTYELAFFWLPIMETARSNSKTDDTFGAVGGLGHVSPFVMCLIQGSTKLTMHICTHFHVFVRQEND